MLWVQEADHLSEHLPHHPIRVRPRDIDLRAHRGDAAGLPVCQGGELGHHASEGYENVCAGFRVHTATSTSATGVRESLRRRKSTPEGCTRVVYEVPTVPSVRVKS